MSRTITTAQQAEFDGNPTFVVLIEAQFDSGTVRLWNGYGDLSWDSETWLGGGELLGIEPIEETTGIEAKGVVVSLSGIPSGLLSIALQEDYQGRPAIIRVGSLYTVVATDATAPTVDLNFAGAQYIFPDVSAAEGDMVASPLQVFRGRMDTMPIAENGQTATITVNVESRLMRLKTALTRRYTHEDQQRDYPGDLFFAFVTGLQNKTLDWGKQG